MGFVSLTASYAGWDTPRPWALPWDQNPEILAGDDGQGANRPEPTAPAGRRVWFRMER